MRRALVIAFVAAAIAPGTATAAWTTETASEPGALGVTSLGFDRQGAGVVLFEGFDQARSPQRYTGSAVRPPEGAWRRAGDLARITWGAARVHLYGSTRALLVAQRRFAAGAFNRGRFETVVAFGRSDGSFGTLRALGRDTSAPASAAGPTGAAIVAFAARRGAVVRVAERAVGRAFARARTRTPEGASRHTVAMNARGERVLAWYRRGWIEARLRRPGDRWGRVRRVGPASPYPDSIHAAVGPTGRVLVAWGAREQREDAPARLRFRIGHHDRAHGWRAGTLQRFTQPAWPADPSALPAFDARGRALVAWGGLDDGRPAVRLARLAGAAIRAVASLPAEPAPDVDALAAGARGALILTWSHPLAPTGPFAALARDGVNFHATEDLSGPGGQATAGSLAAFDPRTRRPVVAWVGLDGGRGVLRLSSEAAR